MSPAAYKIFYLLAYSVCQQAQISYCKSFHSKGHVWGGRNVEIFEQCIKKRELKYCDIYGKKK